MRFSLILKFCMCSLMTGCIWFGFTSFLIYKRSDSYCNLVAITFHFWDRIDTIVPHRWLSIIKFYLNRFMYIIHWCIVLWILFAKIQITIHFLLFYKYNSLPVPYHIFIISTVHSLCLTIKLLQVPFISCALLYSYYKYRSIPVPYHIVITSTVHLLCHTT